MNNTVKRIWTLILAIAMIASMFTATAVAETAKEYCAANGHTWEDDGAPLREGTCEVAGIYKQKCTVCGDTQYINRYGHEYEDSFVDATCTEPQKAGKVCTLCQKPEGELTDVPGSEPLGHDWEETIVEASCKSAAGVQRVCKREGCKAEEFVAFEGEMADAQKAHKYVAQDVAATCTTKGLTGAYICELCGEKDPARPGKETPIDADAHKMDIVLESVKEATCTENGINKVKCSLCEKKEGYASVPAAHKWEETVLEAATCVKDGKVDRKCSECKKEEKNVVIPATGKHDYQEKFVVATCTEPAKYGNVCSVCEQVDEKGWTIVPGEDNKPLGHDYEDSVVEASCELPSGIKKTCSRCDDTYVVAIEGVEQVPALGHKEKVVDDIKATCKTTGWTGKVICERCNKVLAKGEETPIDANGHESDKPTGDAVIKAATCTANGIGKATCKHCGKDMGYVSIKAEHAWVTTDTYEEATCVKDGLIKRICPVCETMEDKVVVPATGVHNYVSASIAATCTEPEKTGKWCSMCHQVDENGWDYNENSKALGHDYDEEVVEATCELPSGIKLTCSRCKDSYVVAVPGEEQVPALGHKPEAVEDIAATCKTKGWTGKVICSVCKKVLAEGEETPIVADAHKSIVGDTLKAADCGTGTNGVGKMVCEYCGKDLGYGTIKAEHDWTNSAIHKSATCVEDGLVDRLCRECGKEEKDVVVKATGKHIYATKTVDATCTEPAKVGNACTMCGAVDEKGWTIVKDSKAQGHDVEDRVIEADCTHAAGILVTCKHEGCDYEELIPFTDADNKQDALGHKPEAVDDIAATCSTTGRTGVVICSVCEEVLNEGEETPINPEAHKSVVNGTPLKEADCKAGTNGIGKMVCELCEKDLGYGTIKAEHEWEDTITLQPTCTKEGKMDRLCQNCAKEEKDVVIPATGKHNYELTDVEATCTEPAKVGNVCTMCKAVDKDGWTIVEGSKATGHDFVETYVEATCEHKSGILRVCQNEGCEFSEVVAIAGVTQDEALPHTPVESEDNIEATCKADGWEGKTVCKVCGTVINEGHKVEAGEDHHVKTLAKTMKAASCTTTGIGKYECSVCGKDLGYGVIEAKHSYKDENVEAATCGKDGKKDLVCSVCGDKVEGVVIPATGKHNYKETFVDATCTEPAMYGDVCTVCGAKKGEMTILTDSEPLGHEFTEEAIEADCEHAAGVKKTCSVCEEVVYEAFTGDMAAPAKGHKPVGKDIVANCKNPGTSGRIECAVCGKELEKGTATPIDPNTHVDEINKILSTATCTKPGTASYKCELCGVSTGYKTYTVDHDWGEAQADGSASFVYKECSVCHQIEIIETMPTYPAAGDAKCDHTYVSVKAIEATTEKDGMTAGKICSKCGKVQSGCEVIPAVKCVHIAGEAVKENEVAATCAAVGTYDEVVYCTLCNDELSRVAKETEKLEHTAEVVPAKEATCTETGLTEGSKCSVCGEVLVAQEETEMVAHTPEVVAAKEATCTEAGLTEGSKCSVCGEVLVAQEETEMAAHTPEVVPAKAATCTEAGLTEGSKCSVCGEVLVAQEETEKVAHTPEAVAAKAATCTEAGLTEGSKCSVCGTVLAGQETIPAKGHTEETIPAKAPTCTEDGLTEGKKCSVCGETIKAQEKDAAKGHTEVSVSGKAATCTEDGLTDGSKCSVCGATIVAQEKISAKGHSYKVSYTYNADYTKETTHYECRNCGHSYTDEHDF